MSSVKLILRTLTYSDKEMNTINYYDDIKNVLKVKSLGDLQLFFKADWEADFSQCWKSVTDCAPWDWLTVFFFLLRCRHRAGEGVWLQWILGGSQRPVRSLRLHSHHEIWQCWRLWERDPRRTVHQPSLPGPAHLFRPCVLCSQRWK